ncbi:MAG: cysteine desulfurase family protein [Nitrospiraceae bacterium]|nr:cysteine desulfurase family protein [Nitrospiraceae bacterium]
MVYLDNNASTKPAPEVVEAVCRVLAGPYGNPSSAHTPGKEAKAIIEEARFEVARLIGAVPEEIFFTSGGTESNNIAIFGAVGETGREKKHVIASLIEHPAITNPLEYLKKAGVAITYLPVDRNGLVNPEALKEALTENTVLVTIMHANNETGVLQPIRELASIARGKGVLFHTDAAQSVGKTPVNVERLGVDMLSLAGHKFHAPKGVGALYIRKCMQGKIKNRVLFGAGHERGMRPGTENTPGIAGLAMACRIAQGVEQTAEKTEHLRDFLLAFLKDAIAGIAVNGAGAVRLPNTLNVRIPGADASELVLALADSVAFSAGSACHEGGKSASKVLKAMGLTDDEAFCSVRISLSRYTTREELKEAVALLQKTVLQAGQGRSGQGSCP